MSLVTRCPACSTTFKVVEDQLRVSAGWVRCGRCTEVFNALEGLYDSGTPSAEPAGAVVEAPVSAPVSQVRAELIRHAPPPPPPAPAPEEASALQPVRRDGQPLAQVPGPEPAPEPLPQPAPPPFPEPVAIPPPPVVPAAWTGLTTTPPEPPDDDPADLPAALDSGLDPLAPSFVRQAERAARWQRPGVRAVLGLLALALAGLAAAQAALLQRDWLAARWPEARPALLALCQVAGCALQPLRRIQHMAVESSGLTRVEGAPLYRLQLVLRNTGELAAQVPALELSLTDAQGQLVTRRVVQARELGARQDTLAGGQELALAALLSGGERRLAGYSIDLFYP